ncbi:hypothetical protein ABH926_000041 [Catenulispora sp. GP43]
MNFQKITPDQPEMPAEITPVARAPIEFGVVIGLLDFARFALNPYE